MLVARHGADVLLAAGGMPPSRYLPADPSQLIGREAEVEETLELMLRPDVRLVTMTRRAGTGKTRRWSSVSSKASARRARIAAGPR
jgi:hypothetical protein